MASNSSDMMMFWGRFFFPIALKVICVLDCMGLSMHPDNSCFLHSLGRGQERIGPLKKKHKDRLLTDWTFGIGIRVHLDLGPCKARVLISLCARFKEVQLYRNPQYKGTS